MKISMIYCGVYKAKGIEIKFYRIIDKSEILLKYSQEAVKKWFIKQKHIIDADVYVLRVSDTELRISTIHKYIRDSIKLAPSPVETL